MTWSAARFRSSALDNRAIVPAVLVLVMYVAWAGIYLGAGNDIRDFIGIGPAFVFRGAVNETLHDRDAHPIVLDPSYHPSLRHNGGGYDGQFSYYIAVAPSDARYYMDDPAYRYSRILHAIVARLLALGSREVIPYTLLLVNLLAAGFGTWALATWLRRRRASPWYALLYGLFPGVFIGVQRDVSEPLAYGLVALGVLAFDAEGGWALPGAALVFALAGLTKNTTVVFPLVLGLWLALGGERLEQVSSRALRWRRASLFLAASVGPCLGYVIFLRVWLGSFSGAGQLSPIPFLGILHHPWRLSYQGVDIVLVALPALIATGALLPQRPMQRRAWLPWLLLVSNVLLVVVFFGRFYTTTYISVGRVATGIALSAVLCVPYLDQLAGRRRLWLAAAAALAVMPFPALAVQGFISLSS